MLHGAHAGFTRIRFPTAYHTSVGQSPLSPIRGVTVSHGDLRLQVPNDYEVIINPIRWVLGV